MKYFSTIWFINIVSIINSFNMNTKILYELKNWEHAHLFQFPENTTNGYNFRMKITERYGLSIIFGPSILINCFAEMHVLCDDELVREPHLDYENGRQFENLDELKNELLRLHKLFK